MVAGYVSSGLVQDPAIYLNWPHVGLCKVLRVGYHYQGVGYLNSHLNSICSYCALSLCQVFKCGTLTPVIKKPYVRLGIEYESCDLLYHNTVKKYSADSLVELLSTDNYYRVFD